MTDARSAGVAAGLAAPRADVAHRICNRLDRQPANPQL